MSTQNLNTTVETMEGEKNPYPLPLWFQNFSGARTTKNILVLLEDKNIDFIGIGGPPVVRRADFCNQFSTLKNNKLVWTYT